MVRRGDVLPVVVQQASRDGRRVEQTIHKIPKPQDPPLSTFSPSPVYETTQEYVFPEVCLPMNEQNDSERVSPRASPQGLL